MRKILYSPGFGAGWTTWNSDENVVKLMLTYQPIIDALERGEKMNSEHPAVKQLEKECEEKFGVTYVCVLGADDLTIAEVSGRVHITEYDGSEGFVEEGGDDRTWM